MLTRRLLAAPARAGLRAVAQRQRFASSALVDLDEEYPNLPSVSPGVAAGGKVESSTLPNGVKVVSSEAGKITSVGLSVAAGSIYESPKEYGASHFLQHLAFKATTKRSALKILRDLEAVGSAPSASAGREAVVYKVTTLPENAEAALTAAFETALSPKLPQYVIDEVGHLVADDLAAFTSSPTALLTEGLYEAAYGEGSPLGHSFYASGDSMPAGLVGAFRDKTYTASGMTVVGTGIAHAQLVSWASGLAEAIPKSSPLTTPTSTYFGGEARIKASSDLTYVSLALAAPGKNQSAALSVLLSIWASALPAGASVFSIPGLVGVTGAAAPSEAGALTAKLLKVLKTTSSGSFALAKTAAKVSALQSLDATLFDHLAHGTYPSSIDSVTESDVSSLSSAIWKTGVTVASVGDVSGVPKKSALA